MTADVLDLTAVCLCPGIYCLYHSWLTFSLWPAITPSYFYAVCLLLIIPAWFSFYFKTIKLLFCPFFQINFVFWQDRPEFSACFSKPTGPLIYDLQTDEHTFKSLTSIKKMKIQCWTQSLSDHCCKLTFYYAKVVSVPLNNFSLKGSTQRCLTFASCRKMPISDRHHRNRD